MRKSVLLGFLAFFALSGCSLPKRRIDHGPYEQGLNFKVAFAPLVIEKGLRERLLAEGNLLLTGRDRTPVEGAPAAGDPAAGDALAGVPATGEPVAGDPASAERDKAENLHAAGRSTGYAYTPALAPEQFVEQLMEALSDKGIFRQEQLKKVAAYDPRAEQNVKDLLKAGRDLGCDLLLLPSVRDWRVSYEGKSVNWYFNLFIWAYGWIPSWWVPDEKFAGTIEIGIDLYSVHSERKFPLPIQYKAHYVSDLSDMDVGGLPFLKIFTIPGVLETTHWKRIAGKVFLPAKEEVTAYLLRCLSNDLKRYSETREFEILFNPPANLHPPEISLMVEGREAGKATVVRDRILLEGVVTDPEVGLKEVRTFINGKPHLVLDLKGKKQLRVNWYLPLQIGKNRISIAAEDSGGLSRTWEAVVTRREKKKKIYAVVIGIDHYRCESRIPRLKYATKDAVDFVTQYLKPFIAFETGLSGEDLSRQITELYNEQATLKRIKSEIGTKLKARVQDVDTVLIFFSGHGGVERDLLNLDRDGYEKYLFPYDTDPDDLYSTALPMREVSNLFSRLHAREIIFFIDSCFAGGTVDERGKPAFASLQGSLRNFLDRADWKRGHVLLASCDANEMALECDAYQHSLFSHFLIEGLTGKADVDHNGQIDVDELFKYLRRNVPAAARRRKHHQHPVISKVGGTIRVGRTAAAKKKRKEKEKEKGKRNGKKDSG
jgi:hypothetical protein